MGSAPLYIPARVVPRLMPRALHISVYITLTRQHILNLDTLHFREIFTKEDTANSLITHTLGGRLRLWDMGEYGL